MTALVIRAHSVAQKTKVVTLILLLLLLMAIVCWPDVALVCQNTFRENPVRFQNLEISVPRRWMVSENNGVLKTWKPCLTRFCESAEAEVSISILRKSVDDTILRKSIEGVLGRLGFEDQSPKTVLANDGVTECLESSHGRPGLQRMAVCFNSTLGFTALAGETQKGAIEGYGIIASIRKANRTSESLKK